MTTANLTNMVNNIMTQAADPNCSYLADSLCQQCGYHNATDVNNNNNLFVPGQLECDHKYIFEIYRECNKNKWNQCSGDGYHFITNCRGI